MRKPSPLASPPGLLSLKAEDSPEKEDFAGHLMTIPRSSDKMEKIATRISSVVSASRVGGSEIGLNARCDFTMPTVSGPREWQRWIASIVIVIGWTIPSLVMGQANPAPGPAPAPTGPDQRPDSPWPSAIILDPPADRAALLGKLRRPDFLLWDGDRFDRWVNAREVRPGPARSGSGVVGSMAVQVHAEGGRARLLVEYRITTNQDEPSVIPVGLDGFLLGRVTEQGRDLPVASLGAGQGWGVGLAGRGEHVVEVETQGPIRSNPAGPDARNHHSPGSEYPRRADRLAAAR